MRTFGYTCAAVAALSAMGLGGCERQSKTETTVQSSGATKGDVLPPGLFVAAAPEGALEVKAAKAQAKQGEVVIMRGRIGGSVDPFVQDRAVFTLMDIALPACSDNPDDHCTTPWDYCCETRKDIVAHAATVRVTDTSGAPLKTQLKGVHGLKELVEVIVVGKVVERDDAGSFVVDASSMHVAGGPGM